jgi:hypothetical protein
LPSARSTSGQLLQSNMEYMVCLPSGPRQVESGLFRAIVVSLRCPTRKQSSLR